MFFHETCDFTLLFGAVINFVDRMNFFYQGLKVTHKCVPFVESVSNDTGFYLLVLYYIPDTALGF